MQKIVLLFIFILSYLIYLNFFLSFLYHVKIILNFIELNFTHLLKINKFQINKEELISKKKIDFEQNCISVFTFYFLNF